MFGGTLEGFGAKKLFLIHTILPRCGCTSQNGAVAAICEMMLRLSVKSCSMILFSAVGGIFFRRATFHCYHISIRIELLHALFTMGAYESCWYAPSAREHHPILRHDLPEGVKDFGQWHAKNE